MSLTRHDRENRDIRNAEFPQVMADHFPPGCTDASGTGSDNDETHGITFVGPYCL